MTLVTSRLRGALSLGRMIHNPEVEGSCPSLATVNPLKCKLQRVFLFLVKI
jgi:hypothetical protein